MIPSTFFLPEYYLEPILNKTESYKFTTRTIDLLNNDREIEREIIRKVELTYIGTRKELFVYHVLTTKVDIKSGETIQNENLLKEDVYAFGIVVIGVNDKGEIVQIYNLKEMQNRWDKKVQELRKHNSGHGFEVWSYNIAAILRDEEKTLFFLNSKNMFGLYFHGLFGINDINVVPKQRTAAILELDNVEVTEQIWADKRGPKFIIAAQKCSGSQEKIMAVNEEIIKYEGKILYDNDNQLLDGFLEIESKNKMIKYSVVWVG